MGKTKKILFLGIFATLALTSCGNIFEDNGTGGHDSPQTQDVEYSAEDIKYYTTADEEICKLSSGSKNRTYAKAYDGFCAVAIANIGEYFGPVLVGKDAAQVCFKQNYNSTIVGSGGSIIYDDVEYFYSRADYFLSGNINWKTKYSNYCSKATTLEEVARDVASKATFREVDPSLKKELVFTELVDGTLSVKAGPYAQGKTELVIPSTYDGKNVSEIEKNSFNNLNSLQVLRFEKNSKVKKIGDYAFQGCTNLKYAVIPQSVTTIGNGAFKQCSSELMIYCEAESKPSGYYESSTYGYWYGSADKVWYGMVDFIETDKYRFGVSIYDTILVSKYIGDETEITIPSVVETMKVTQIGKYAFSNFNRVTSIQLPSDLDSIGSYAFEKCAFLREIRVPEKTRSVGDYAFQSCSNLIFAFIPQSVTTIGNGAFKQCSSELMIYCEAESKPSGYYESSTYGYWYGSADHVWYGMVDYIETDLYKYGKKIDGTLSVSKYLGSETDVIIPETYNGMKITSLASNAFDGKNRIKSITLPADLAKINSYCFKGCTQLESIHIPSKVTAIEQYAFQGCTNLKYAVIPQSVTTIGNGAFKQCSSELMIYCEAESRPSGYYESSTYGYWYGSVDQIWWGTTDYIETDNYLYGIRLDNSLIISKYLGSETVVNIPGEIMDTAVSAIGKHSFDGKNRITTLVLSNTIDTIGDYAFANCTMLTSVKLNSYLTKIGQYAFMNCSRLEQIVIPQSVTTIGNGAFKQCSSSLKIFCEVSSRPSGYYQSSTYGYWYGSGTVYYRGSWAYDGDGNPYVK